MQLHVLFHFIVSSFNIDATAIAIHGITSIISDGISCSTTLFQILLQIMQSLSAAGQYVPGLKRTMDAAHIVSFTRLLLTWIQLGLDTGYTIAVRTRNHMPMARDDESSASPSNSLATPSPDTCHNYHITVLLAANGADLKIMIFLHQAENKYAKVAGFSKPYLYLG